MDQRISLLVVGQDVLKSKAEVIMCTCTFQVLSQVNVYDISIYLISMLDLVSQVGSVCTTLTHTYCEDAYSLLQNLDIKKLLVSAFSTCNILCRLQASPDYIFSEGTLLIILNVVSHQLAGILLDTSNLSKKCTNRDSDAVQLLLFGTFEHMRHELFQQCNIQILLRH